MKDRKHVALVDSDCAVAQVLRSTALSVPCLDRNQGIRCVLWQLFGQHGLTKVPKSWNGASIAQDVGNPTTGPLHYRRKFTIGSFKEHLKERHFQNQLVDSLCTSGCLQTKSE